MLNETSKPCNLMRELSQFTGDLERYQSINPKLIYTPGVNYLAQEAEAYWLIDAIASYVPSKKLQKAIRHDELRCCISGDSTSMTMDWQR